MIPAETHQLGEHVRVGAVGFRPGRGVAFAVTGHLHRVDREHLIPGRAQRTHPRSALGLDADHHLIRARVLPETLRDQPVQLADPCRPFGQPAARQPPPGLIDDFHVVVIFGPVITDEQHNAPSPARVRVEPRRKQQ